MHENSNIETELHLLSEGRVELLGNVVLLVGDALGTEHEDQVGVGLAVDVHRMQVLGLDHIHANLYMQGVIRWQAL